MAQCGLLSRTYPLAIALELIIPPRLCSGSGQFLEGQSRCCNQKEEEGMLSRSLASLLSSLRPTLLSSPMVASRLPVLPNIVI